MIKKIFLFLITILGLLFLKPAISLAKSDFSTNYNISYHVNSAGSTHTKFNISLINNLSNIYASEFSLSIGSTDLNNIHAYNLKNDLNPKIAIGNKTTNITIPFTDKILGKDKAQNFTLEFDSLDFANQLGSVWEISIPKFQKTESLNSYNLILSVPNSFGLPSTISPKPNSKSSLNNYTTYKFNQQDLLDKGISAIFGTTQYFDFSLNYHLDNPNVYQVKTEITLPPDTTYQKVLYEKLEPKPESIHLDNDGNWLADYILSPKQNLDIIALGSVEINLNPVADFPGFVLENKENYLSTQKYWEVQNPNIIKLAKELKTPAKIYQYVVDNLIYDYGRLSETTTRFGAANVLDNQDSAICMEFTDLFITLARAADIPARAINGFAYTTNTSLRPLSLKKDVLHAWPEYYNYKTNIWTPVDPTWGNTTGGIDFFNFTDLNHFAFVILGQDSQYPVPAGAYKTPKIDSKDVDVHFSTPKTKNPNSSIKIKLPIKTLAGLPINGQIILENTGNIALYNQSITLSSNHFDLKENTWKIPVLPPFSNRTINIELTAPGWTSNFTDQIIATSEYSNAKHQITLLPTYTIILNNYQYLIVVFLILTSLTLAFKITKNHFKKK
ncbi:MAG: transglutaminase family protein [Patescibacteria group bacterium]|nr:transglutaminase family protein [Patescibacteria group bacterium]